MRSTLKKYMNNIQGAVACLCKNSACFKYCFMKYFVADFKIVCEAEQLQVARELLSAAACEAGFEAFEIKVSVTHSLN